MENAESDYIFLVECKTEDEDADYNVDGDNDGRKDCNSAEYTDDDNPWPQTYMESMDVYSGVASPNVSFLHLSSLSSLSGSFLSSSPKRRQAPKIIPSLDSPLLLPVADDHSHHPQWTSSAQELSKHHKSPQIRQSSFVQAVVNTVNLLCGVALLSTPYAVKEGGWVGLSLLFVFGIISFYTGILLGSCLDSQPGLNTYPDIGEAAFGLVGRLIISIAFYAELYTVCVEFIILESDNLSALFPNALLSLGGYQLSSHYLFAIAVTVVVLPTVWLRDLSVLSYISAGGIVVTILLVICLFWVGLVDNIGFQTENTNMLNLSTLPVSIGIYGYCYAGHAVLPNIYMSMEKKSHYPLVLLVSFAICTLLYVGVAIMGYLIFSDSIESQFTLNLPANLLASKIAVWATVISPLTKYPFF